MQFCMFHDRISAWNKIIAKFRWHYISVCSSVEHDWKLADDTPLIINGLVAAFSSNNLSTSCVLPIQDSSRNLRTVVIPSSSMKLIT